MSIQKNKVVLIRPENIYYSNNYPSLGLICIGSALKAKGYDVKIINCAFKNYYFEIIKKEISDCLFVGIGIMTAEIPSAFEIMKFIKEKSNVPIVAGGWHTTLFPHQMANCEYVDYVVVGEGDEHIVNIADKLKNNNVISEKIFFQKFVDMEKLPLPDYTIYENIEKFINNFLTDKLCEYVDHPIRWLPYQSSRGCPSQCTFCINVVTNNTHYRKKSAEKVVDEIEYLLKKYNLTHLKIIDDNFFVDIDRVRDICNGIVEKGIKLTWDAECRPDYFNEKMINEETLELLKKAGLVQLTIGLESGSQHTLKLMKKNIIPEQGEMAVKECNKHKIIARCSLIIEIPGETLKDMKETVAFAKNLRQYPYFVCGVQIFRPYPKSELTKKLEKDGYLKEPQNFLEWTKRENLDLYVGVHNIRPWQIDKKNSNKIAYYMGMESGLFIKNYQLKNKIDVFINNMFIRIAKIRNKLNFYGFAIDQLLYKKFNNNFYKKIQEKEWS